MPFTVKSLFPSRPRSSVIVSLELLTEPMASDKAFNFYVIESESVEFSTPMTV